MGMGRPSKYTTALIESGWYYVKHWRGIGDEIPSNAGLAVHLHISRSTLQDWANDEAKVEFSDMLAEIQCTQERTLINKGLNGDFNSNITKLVLAKHGYVDKQELTGRDGGPLDREWTVTVVTPDVENKECPE